MYLNAKFPETKPSFSICSNNKHRLITHPFTANNT